MPKNKFQDFIFTAIMASVMVYGMVVYNVALNTGGVSGQTILFKTPSFGTWVQTWAMNFPMAICYQMFYCGPLVRLIFRFIQ